VRIVVADNGPGVPAASRAQVFQPFYTTKPKGTGLGLAITRKLVTFMRGTIELAGGEGTGATFVVSLDPHEVPESARRLQTSRPPALRGAR
jgi:signal transduction histidine kinase